MTGGDASLAIGSDQVQRRRAKPFEACSSSGCCCSSSRSRSNVVTERFVRRVRRDY